MLNKSLNKFILPSCYTQPLLFGVPLVLGISTPVTAQMYEGVNNFPSPQLNNNVYQSPGYNQSDVEFTAIPSNQYPQSFDRYIVYVDSNNFQTLQQVRQVEPTAYVRQFQRRYIIQAGVFSKPANAQRRIRQLAAYGVNNTRIFSPNQNREIPNNDAIGGIKEQISRYYYVAIPSSAKDVREIAARIQQDTGFYRGISASQNRRGHYVAVGPFARYGDAQRWNDYLHNIGFGNARIHYGR
ncbi:SPOR domain-containing protein [Calothrix rhizosoleniae]|uniref:SPOR domain-containing protein n=1 Tax=Calothrix rhizosoleniae TaxID=888997 RepID=UPI000B4A49FC|nr:SPOR domain-containing protein [Calothrix rhizosoleniae]